MMPPITAASSCRRAVRATSSAARTISARPGGGNSCREWVPSITAIRRRWVVDVARCTWRTPRRPAANVPTRRPGRIRDGR
jgi:hypothetical protein